MNNLETLTFPVCWTLVQHNRKVDKGWLIYHYKLLSVLSQVLVGITIGLP